MRLSGKVKQRDDVPPDAKASASGSANNRAEEGRATPAAARPRRFWTLPTGNGAPVAVHMPEADAADPLAAFSTETHGVPRRTSRTSRLPQWPRDRWLAIAALLVALIEAGLLLRGVPQVFASAASDGRLRISSETPGAQVLVNGIISGPAPFELRLRPGRHGVEVRLGTRVRRFAADVHAGADTYHHVDLPAATGAGADVIATAGKATTIEIASDPAGARVSVDGRARGVTPLRLTDLAPGEHQVVLANAAGAVTRRVRVESAAPSSLVVSMPKPTAATSGWVKVQLPVVAQIFEGSELLGSTEVDRLMLPAGPHRLRLVNSALRFESNHTVDVLAGQTRVVNVTLPTSRLSVNAIPWAQVWIDGQAKGETPIGNLAVPIGTHEILLRHPQLGEQRRSVTVTQGEVTRVGVDLRR